MPAVGINMHYFGEPFIWNGLNNLLVDIVVDRNYAGYGNTIVNHTETSYNSSLGYQGNKSPAWMQAPERQSTRDHLAYISEKLARCRRSDGSWRASQGVASAEELM